MRLENKVVLITGAARGIGLAIAAGMAREGARVMLTDIDARELGTVRERIQAGGHAAEAFPLDVCDGAAVAGITAEVLRREGRIDVLVNNAGIAAVESFLDTTEERWDAVMAVNLKSVFLCCKAVVPGMIERRSGKIINVASVAAKVGGGLLGTSAYASSKAGVIGLSKGLARELAPYGINVNTIAPGSITTAITRRFMTRQQQEDSVKRIPLGRRGVPEDIVGAAVFLACSESDFMTGATLDINGGTRME